MQIFMIFFIVLTLVIIIPPSYAQLEDDRVVYLNKAKKAFDEGKFEDSIFFLDKILAVESDNVDALYAKGVSLIGFGKTDEGLQYFDKALEIDPNHLLSLSAKADQLVISDKFEEALPYYEKISEIDPNNVSVLSYRGDLLVKSGKTTEALAYYEKILELAPRAKDPLGTLNTDKILAINPNHIDALNTKGSSLLLLGRNIEGYTIIFESRLDEAISYFDKVLEIEPDNIDGLFNKGRALIQKDKAKTQENATSNFYEEGMSDIEKVLKINPNHVGSITVKADEIVKENKFSEGLILLDQALAIDPNYEDALFLKGFVLTKLGNLSDSITFFDKVLQNNPENKLAEINLSATSGKLGYRQLDGFLDVMVHDSNGFLSSHVRVTKLSLLNHTLGDNLIESWPVVDTVQRNGTMYELRQLEKESDVHFVHLYGGAVHYGIPYSSMKVAWLMTANYWMYYVHEGDKVTFVYSAFNPIEE